MTREITYCYIEPNKWSRPGTVINDIKGLVVHWVENAGQGPWAVRDYFDRRKQGKDGYGSAHYIIGMDGKILCTIPYYEMAYHVGSDYYTPEGVAAYGEYPNATTIGVELCHPDWTGKPTGDTVDSAIELFAFLAKLHGIKPEMINTHSWVTNKKTERGPCHKWYHEHPEELQAFRDLVGMEMTS